MPAPVPPQGDLKDEEKKILEALGRDELQVDVLTRKCGLPSPVVSATLLKLEMKRRVRQMPGKVFTRTD
jgi:DNA processing protein